ncbi:hypothetical protein [Maricaulis sp. CAU 1757]
MRVRRLIEHLREQNWLAVGLDFIIVVVGVFMGFQLTAWAQDQADAERAAVYRARLVAEIEQAHESLGHSLHYNEGSIRSLALLDRLLSEDESADPEIDYEPYWLEWISWVGVFHTPDLGLNVFEEMRSNGDLPLLADHEVAALISLANESEHLLRVLAASAEDANRHNGPIMQHFDVVPDPEAWTGVTYTTVDSEAVLSDAEFPVMLRHYKLAYGSNRLALINHRYRVEATLAVMRGEISGADQGAQASAGPADATDEQPDINP